MITLIAEYTKVGEKSGTGAIFETMILWLILSSRDSSRHKCCRGSRSIPINHHATLKILQSNFLSIGYVFSLFSWFIDFIGWLFSFYTGVFNSSVVVCQCLFLLFVVQPLGVWKWLIIPSRLLIEIRRPWKFYFNLKNSIILSIFFLQKSHESFKF
jgi:hypothetical protein